MNRAEKIEAIRNVYGDKAVEDCEKWDYRLPSENLNGIYGKDGLELLDESFGWRTAQGTEPTYLYRYPREVEKPKCIWDDVEIKWSDGYMCINGTSQDCAVGSRIFHNGEEWQIAEFLYDVKNGLAVYRVPIASVLGNYIRANRVRLVRWE